MARLLLSLLLFALAGCNLHEPETVRIQVDIAPPDPPPDFTATAGTTPLGLAEYLFINRAFAWRDGLLHVPTGYAADQPAPLLVWLHGGGGHARDAKKLFPFADTHGVVVLALDSRHNTWDGIDSPFGPDVRFIERAMRHTMQRLAIDPGRVALGGASDGASYALALGRSNGDLFSHLIAVSPWRLAPPGPTRGSPRIFVAHGLQDAVYPEWHSRRFLVPALQESGYDVTYFASDGPHWVTEETAHALIRWLADDTQDR